MQRFRDKGVPKQRSVMIAGLALIAALAVWAATAPGPEREIGCYVTSLRGRTLSQIHNVAVAAQKVNGALIAPGDTFSFVKIVGPWTADRGYEKAPVSYDGELVRSWGGGVCQLSTTLYNAALLAGLEIIERHAHHWPPRYAPLGRDAAVAYSDIDLKFRNNLSEPVRVAAAIEGDSLVCRVSSAHASNRSVRVESEIASVTHPGEVIQNWAHSGPARRRLVNRGHPGFEVITYRRINTPSGTTRQLVSEDSYPVMNRIVRIASR